MTYLYFTGLVITFVILCSFANKEGWVEPDSFTSKEEAVGINLLASFFILFFSVSWPLLAFIFGLMYLCKAVGKINIRFDFKNEEPYDD